MANRDLLQPFLNADKNRDEIFMVEASGFLYNKAAHIIIAMLMNYDRYVENFPHISIFKGLTALQIFEATKLFSSLEVLNQMSRCQIRLGESTEEEIETSVTLFRDTMIELEEVNTQPYLILPIFAYGLSQIVKERCCRKIYITNMQRFSEWEMGYIHGLFRHKIDKIELLIGDPFDLYMEHHEELTTIFLNDIYMLHKINDEVIKGTLDKETVNKHLFSLRVTNDIVTENKDIHILEYTCDDLFKEYEKNSIHVSLLPLLPINDNDTNKIVRC